MPVSKVDNQCSVSQCVEDSIILQRSSNEKVKNRFVQCGCSDPNTFGRVLAASGAAISVVGLLFKNNDQIRLLLERVEILSGKKTRLQEYEMYPRALRLVALADELMSLRKYKKAAETYEKALNLDVFLDLDRADVLQQQGRAWSQASHFGEAAKIYLEVAELYKGEGLYDDAGGALMSAGDAYKSIKQYRSAEAAYKQAAEIYAKGDYWDEERAANEDKIKASELAETAERNREIIKSWLAKNSPNWSSMGSAERQKELNFVCEAVEEAVKNREFKKEYLTTLGEITPRVIESAVEWRFSNLSDGPKAKRPRALGIKVEVDKPEDVFEKEDFKGGKETGRRPKGI